MGGIARMADEEKGNKAKSPRVGLLECLEDNARRFPDKIFIESVDQGRRITHGAFARLTARIADFLRARGIGAGDRVALLAENGIEHLALYLGTLRHGATICTVHVEMNAVYFEDILEALDPALVVCQEGLAPEGLRAKIDCDWLDLGHWVPQDESDGSNEDDGARGLFAQLADMPNDAGTKATPVNNTFNNLGDDAAIFYTSGTESHPKGVVLSYAELIANAALIAERIGLTEDDRILEFRSFNWVSAQALSALGPALKGASLILAKRFSRSRYFDWVRDHRATIAVCNPTGIAMLLNEPVAITQADVPDLRFMTSSSAPLPVETWKRFEDRYGIPIAQGYGSSEAVWIAASDEHTARRGTVGLPLAYHALRIVDVEGRTLAPGEEGEVEIGGDPETQYRYLAEDGSVRVHAKGRLRTGDLGVLDADGYLTLTGRARELIIRGGVNIAPAEIDNVILEMAGVAEAATIGVPDAIYGEEVVAYVAAGAGGAVSPEAVMRHCEVKLPPFKMPKEILVREVLPKTERGKMDRNALIEDWKRSRDR